MATVVLLSLAAGYALVGGFFLVIGFGSEGALLLVLAGPIVAWPATLIVSFIAMLIILAIAENT